MSHDERALVEGFARDRDEAGFRTLYRAYTPRLYALALRLTGGPASDAEELVQEAWVRALERLDAFRFGSSFSTWLSGILINCYREFLRRRSRDPLPLDPPRAAPLELVRPARPTADRVDVERAIAGLPDGYREVIVLHDLNGYTHREIADLLAIDEGTSKSQLARGRARLRERLTHRPGERDEA